ncbi:uncharacterized protein LOC124404231 [Diprion similis]|uniref:uncharacterized protein LOC124404231 n=1 Tax=Diprion similis TaxID=362088 RepID=UPI001EF9158F|nr:uncharacterized protein LOC124404231 [Diprion similis]
MRRDETRREQSCTSHFRIHCFGGVGSLARNERKQTWKMGDAKEKTKKSSKAKEKSEKHSKTKKTKLVLTESEKQLGIRIIQPDQKAIDAMTRLYAVPSEKLRVWTAWLTKVGERAEDWQWWLRAQIRLTARISNRLQRASAALEGDENGTLEHGDDLFEEFEKEDALAVDNGQGEPENPPEVSSTSPEPESTPNVEETSKEAGDTEESAVNPGEESEAGETVTKKAAKGKKTKTKTKTKVKKQGKLERKIEYKEGFWPLGVRWEPFSHTGKWKPPPKRQPDEIPIPRTEEEMMDLIRKIRHQGVVYRSLYKHWSQTADQAVREILGRTVLPTKLVYPNGEDVPFSFSLETDPDIGYAIEHDDEEVLPADPGRERITHDFVHLYFNLTDKPGKGGKPWL